MPDKQGIVNQLTSVSALRLGVDGYLLNEEQVSRPSFHRLQSSKWRQNKQGSRKSIFSVVVSTTSCSDKDLPPSAYEILMIPW